MNKFFYLYHRSRDGKKYLQRQLTQKLEEDKAMQDTDKLFLAFISTTEEFLVGAKQNEEVSNIWSRIFIAVYTICVKTDVLLCKLVYTYLLDKYEKVEFRNTIADLMYECKSEQYKDLTISKVKLGYLQTLYKCGCVKINRRISGSH